MTRAAATVAPAASGERRAPQLIDVGEDPHVRVAFTGRVDERGAAANLSLLVGDTAGTPAARAAALALVDAGLDDAVFMQQVHGGSVARVTAADRGRGAHTAASAVPGVDALVTADTDVALVVLAADCVPVVLVDPGAGIAAVHAGRGGVVTGVVPAAVAALAPQDPATVVALVGPAIGGCCYEVEAPLAAEVAGLVPAAAATTSWGTPSLDLPAAVTAQLHSAGVARVERVGACTRCSGDTWFSHRATTAEAAPAGRQAGIVVRTGPPHPAAPTSSLHSP